MNKVTGKVVNCHELSIRRAPWIPELDHEVVAKVKVGDTLSIFDPEVKWYSWDSKEFYKVEAPNGLIGFARTSCLEI